MNCFCNPCSVPGIIDRILVVVVAINDISVFVDFNFGTILFLEHILYLSPRVAFVYIDAGYVVGSFIPYHGHAKEALVFPVVAPIVCDGRITGDFHRIV